MPEMLRPPLGVGWDYFQGWNSQYERMERWFDRLLLRQAEFSLDDRSAHDEFWDTAFAFFQNAYHLKDWILYDHPTMKQDVEDFIHAEKSLSYCADLCNGTKHREISRRNRVPGHLIGVRQFAPHLPNKQTLHILGPDGPLRVDALASQCMECWKKFVSDNSEQLGRSANPPPARESGPGAARTPK